MRIFAPLMLLSFAVACGEPNPKAVEGAKAVGGAAAVPVVKKVSGGGMKAEADMKGEHAVPKPAGELDHKIAPVEAKVVAPRDAATGLPTGKRRHDPVNVAPVESPRDAASGLPTGKRQHKPVTVTKPIDK